MDDFHTDPHVTDVRLFRVCSKIKNGERLDVRDGLDLYASPDLIGIGWLADRVRRLRHGKIAYFVYNQHINYTNVCINRCRFCAFARDQATDGAYTDTIEEIRRRLLERIHEPIREIHVVGGVNPELPFSYYIDLLNACRDIRPEATLKAFTAVEIAHLHRISGLTMEKTLEALKDAGLSMLPGGGAEVMSDRIHDALFPKKITADQWLHIMETAHAAGLSSNATLLYGHVETHEERIRHLLRLRDLQDRTGGFSAFIPLAFHSRNTGLPHIAPTTGFDDLKTIAIARLMLDNFDHIKAYWVMIGLKLAQVALSFGADDMDGTIVEEKITHMAGATSPKGLRRDDLIRLIAAAGFTPVERDSFYRPVFTAEERGVHA